MEVNSIDFVNYNIGYVSFIVIHLLIDFILGSVSDGNDGTSNNNLDDDDEDTSTSIDSDSNDSNDSNEGTNHSNVEDSDSSEEDSTSSNESVDKESIGIEDNKDDDDTAVIDDDGNNNNNDDDNDDGDDDDTIDPGNGDNVIEDINDKKDDNDGNNDDTNDSHHDISKDIDTNLDADNNGDNSNEDNETTGDGITKEETNNGDNPADKTDTSRESASQGTVVNEGTDVKSGDLEVGDGTEEGQSQSTENNAHNNEETGGSKETVIIDTPEDATLDGDQNISVGGDDDDDDTTTGSDHIPTIGGEQELIDQPIFETIEDGFDFSDNDEEDKSSNGICPTHFTGLVQDNSNCATYYNCSQGHIVPGRDDCAFLECPYPMLYSNVERACKQYTDVQCGYRYEPQSPCKYNNTSIITTILSLSF